MKTITPQEEVDSEYARAWSFYRGLRGVTLSLFLFAIIECRLLSIIPALLFGLTFFTYFLCASWLAHWSCPRCGRPFFRYAFLRSLYGGKCFYCHLPKWAVSEDGNLIESPRLLLGWKRPVRLPLPGAKL